MSMQRAAGSIATAQGGTSAIPLVMSVAADRVGQILRGCYRIERRLASGSVTEIYQAYNLKRQELCVIKMLRRDADPKLEPQRRFEQEASIISRLSHPHIAEGSRFAHTEDGQPFMVMEALRGRTLQDWLAEEPTLPLKKTLQILEAIASALQYVHELGILHPSVRPGSIFLHRRRDSDADFTVKLFDFGLANEMSAPGATASGPWPLGVIVGTPGYLPPEALQTDARVTDLADQWSLAVLAYRTLTGRLPFQSSDPYLMCALIRTTEPVPLQALRPDLPAHICDAINRAMSRDPAGRFARLPDFLRALSPQAAPTTSRQVGRSGRSDAPQTKKFESLDLIELCRKDDPDPKVLPEYSAAVPEPISQGDSTNPYSQEDRSRLLTLVQPDARPVEPSAEGSAEGGKDRAERRSWVMGLALVTLLSVLITLAMLWQSHRRAKLLEAAASELAMASLNTRSAPPVIPFAVDRAKGSEPPASGDGLGRVPILTCAQTGPGPAPRSEAAAGDSASSPRKRTLMERERRGASLKLAAPAPELPPAPPPTAPVPPAVPEEAPRQVQLVD